MADKGRKPESVFFIYDHSMLKKEEDDLKDAILFFSPEEVSVDNQCMLCGQLMGMSEFLVEMISKSSPAVFKFEREKYAIKRSGTYSLVLQGGCFTPDSILLTSLNSLYETFVTFHGSIDSLKLRCKECCKESVGGYITELANIWRTLLHVSRACQGYSLSQTFQSLPYVQLPKTGSHLFLQASHLLQSSQRRPYVLAGAILYKNGVLSTQLPPRLTRHLTFLQNQMPHITQNTDYDLPKGCKIVTVFLTDEEMAEISPLDSHSRRHCKVTDFSMQRENEANLTPNIQTAQVGKPNSKQLTRRLTCPNLNSSANKSNPGAVSQKALQSFLTSERRKFFHDKQGSVNMEPVPWGNRKSQVSLSHVPIVECRSGESPLDSDAEMGNFYNQAVEKHFGESYRQIETNTMCENESDSDTENDSVEMYQAVRSIETQFETQPMTNEVLENRPLKESTDLDKDTFKSTISIEHPNKVKNVAMFENVAGGYEQKDQGRVESVGENSNAKSSASENVGSKRFNSKSSRETSQNENPSISDLDEDDDIEANVKPRVDSERYNITGPADTDTELHNNNNRTIEIIISESEKSVSENERDTEKEMLQDSTNVSSKLPDSQKIRLVQSLSSEDDAKSRFYDGLADDQTETLMRVSSHSLHQHRVDVHIDSPKPDEDGETEKTFSDSEGHVRQFDGLDGKSERSSGFSENNVNKEQNRSENPVKSVCVNSELSFNAKHDVLESLTSERDNMSDREVELKSTNTKADSAEMSMKKHSNFEKGELEKRATENVAIEDLEENRLKPGDTEIENKDPNIQEVTLYSRTVSTDARYSQTVSTDTQKYESEIETEDESISLANTEPCINCLELEAQIKDQKKNVQLGVVRCAACIAKFNKQKMFGCPGQDSEVIDFEHKGRERYESGTETEGLTDIEGRHYVRHNNGENSANLGPSSLSSFSSEVSTDSTISKYWTNEMDGLNDVTLYVQCHSDISLLLLLENPEQYQENLFHSLWKGSLAHLADLDFYIKECTENSDDENEGETKDMYKYLRYNTFSADLRGTMQDSSNARKSLNLHQILGSLHAEFQHDQCLSDVTLRSHLNSCYGHSNHVDETFFQPDMQQKLISGLPVPRDPVYNMDVSARRLLAKDKRLSLL